MSKINWLGGGGLEEGFGDRSLRDSRGASQEIDGETGSNEGGDPLETGGGKDRAHLES